MYNRMKHSSTELLSTASFLCWSEDCFIVQKSSTWTEIFGLRHNAIARQKGKWAEGKKSASWHDSYLGWYFIVYLFLCLLVWGNDYIDCHCVMLQMKQYKLFIVTPSLIKIKLTHNSQAATSRKQGWTASDAATWFQFVWHPGKIWLRW